MRQVAGGFTEMVAVGHAQVENTIKTGKDPLYRMTEVALVEERLHQQSISSSLPAQTTKPPVIPENYDNLQNATYIKVKQHTLT